MEQIKRVLVAVDLTEMDETLVQYIAMLSHNISLDKVYFFNALKNLELPEAIAKKYPDLVAPLDEATTKQIQYTIDEAAGNQLKASYEITVTEGNRAEQILKWARIKEVDLIVLGRKSGLEGDGIVSGKVVKLAPCSVIMVPEVIPPKLEKIVTTIDFSDASKLAFEFSLNLAANIPGLEITCLNIYNVPWGYSSSGKTYEEFSGIMKRNAEESFDGFLATIDTKEANVKAKFELDEKDDVAMKIYQFSVKERANAIVVGSKGRTQAAAILIGSIAEKLITLNARLPLIVVKERRHNMDFLEALLNI